RELNQGKIILNFNITTKMDSPEFKFDEINSAVDSTLRGAIRSKKISMKNAGKLPRRFFEGVADGASGTTEAIINGAVSIGRGISKALAGAFKAKQGKQETE
ncbi:hypothetical protein ACFL4C_01865, partial [Candidatus Omnitrophota bacterium]